MALQDCGIWSNVILPAPQEKLFQSLFICVHCVTFQVEKLDV